MYCKGCWLLWINWYYLNVIDVIYKIFGNVIKFLVLKKVILNVWEYKYVLLYII